MRSFLVLYLLTTLIVIGNGFLHQKKPTTTTTDDRHLANVKIYSNLAEIIQPLGSLPLEFSADDWNDIRADSVTLVGANVNLTQQTITEKKKSANNTRIHVRLPTSSNNKIEFVKATLIDERRNIVKLIDKDISKEPIYLTVPGDHIVYDDEPSQPKYYVSFTFESKDQVYVSYLRSNLNWKTRYQLNLFDEPKTPVLITMADIRNDGQSKVEIEHAELLGGDINLQMYAQQYLKDTSSNQYQYAYASPAGAPGPVPSAIQPSVGKGEEVAGLYIFAINQPFSIEAKTNYLLPMFRPRVTVQRYGLISKSFHGTAGSSTGKAQRSYRLSSDHFLSSGNCIIRESDRLVGETSLPDLAAKNHHEFSIGQDSDIVFKENVTLFSSRTYNESIRRGSVSHERTESVYTVNLLFKNFKKARSVKIEYKQHIYGHSVKLLAPNTIFAQDGSTIKCNLTLDGDDEKAVSYKFELIN